MQTAHGYMISMEKNADSREKKNTDIKEQNGVSDRPVPTTVPKGWTIYSQKTDTRLSWKESKRRAEAQGGRLLTLQEAEVFVDEKALFKVRRGMHSSLRRGRHCLR